MTIPRKRAPGGGRKPQGARPKVKVSISLAPHIHKAAARFAKVRGQSLSAFIEELLYFRLLETSILDPADNSDARPDEPRAGV